MLAGKCVEFELCSKKTFFFAHATEMTIHSDFLPVMLFGNECLSRENMLAFIGSDSQKSVTPITDNAHNP